MTTIPTNPTQPVDGDPFAGAVVGCSSCTVPTDRPDGLCSFCAGYQPPPAEDPVADALIRCANYTELARLDVDKLIADLPASTPLFAYADLVAAKAHLAAAVRKLDQAATQLHAEGDR